MPLVETYPGHYIYTQVMKPQTLVPSSVVAAFQASRYSPQVREDDQVVQQVVELCTENGMAPSDLVRKWEELACDNESHRLEDGPTLGQIQVVAETLLQEQQESDVGKSSFYDLKERSPQMNNKSPYSKSSLSAPQEFQPKRPGNLFGFPTCKCGEVASLWTVKKEGPNKGRGFFSCNVNKCKFFQWAVPGTYTAQMDSQRAEPDGGSPGSVPTPAMKRGGSPGSVPTLEPGSVLSPEGKRGREVDIDAETVCDDELADIEAAMAAADDVLKRRRMEEEGRREEEAEH
mmetsp:Transcript_7418/g.17165  ORF Transcript_7418/g.17165 Transcript_7418/m.17165 type:complete len:288 (-) Transcript_7418:102-965(-)